MTALPAAPELAGNRAVWIWNSDDPTVLLPSGVLIDHGDHTLLVAWIPTGSGKTFTLDSLLPLSIVEVVDCSACGSGGRIREGAWLPVKGQVQR